MPLPSDYAKRHRQERKATEIDRLSFEAVAREARRIIEIERRALEAQAIAAATSMTVWPDNVGLATPDERQARKET